MRLGCGARSATPHAKMRSKNINQDGSGNGPWTDFINRVLQRLTELQFYDSQTVSVEQMTRGTRFHVKIPPAKPGGAGWDWMYPSNKEMDPTLTYKKGKFAYLSPLNPLVTAGLVDLDSSGKTLQATAGIWLALQDIEPATVSGWNVPQDPPHGSGTAVPSGTPLIGDIDITSPATVKWLLFKSIC